MAKGAKEKCQLNAVPVKVSDWYIEGDRSIARTQKGKYERSMETLEDRAREANVAKVVKLGHGQESQVAELHSNKSSGTNVSETRDGCSPGHGKSMRAGGYGEAGSRTLVCVQPCKTSPISCVLLSTRARTAFITM
jgi:hypothetical protein